MFSNYTIKQALPRLIIAAVTINLSYWICALAVDASNLLGNSIYHVLSNLSGKLILDATAIPELYDAAMRGVQGAQNAGTTAGAVGLTGIIGAMFIPGVGLQLAGGIFMLLLSLALGIAAAILIALIVLAARQAVIIVLIVVAPIAFALYILPGTKPIFDKWRKLLTTMLVFFPLFAALFGGAQMAGNILVSAAASQPQNTAATPESAQYAAALLIMGLGAQFAPLFLAPWLLRNSTGFLGQLASKMQQRSKGMTSAMNRKARKDMGAATKRTWQTGTGGLRRYASRKSDTRHGRALAWAMNGGARREAIDKALEAEDKQHKAEYISGSEKYRDYAKRAVGASTTTGLVEGAVSDEAKTEHIGSAANEALYLRNAVASAEHEHAEAEKSQLHEELKSEKGREVRGYVRGGANEDLARAAERLGDASSAKHHAEQAKTNATRILTSEHANEITSNANVAAIAGGIDDRYGAQRAVAMADNIMEQQLNEGVKIERSSLGSVSDKDVLKRASEGEDEAGNAISLEARMAASSEIASRGYAQNHIEIFRDLNKQMSDIAHSKGYYTEAQSSLNRANYADDDEYNAAIESFVDDKLISSKDEDVTALRYMQKQVMADIGGNVPFGVGDEMRGAMGRGVSRMDFDKEWAKRLTKKLSAPAIQKFKSEDAKWIEAGFANKTLKPSVHGAALQASAMDILRDPTATANTKKEIKDFFDKLQQQNIIQVSFNNYDQYAAQQATQNQPPQSSP